MVAVLGDRQQPGGDAVAVGLHPSDLDSIVPEQQGVAGDNAQALAPSENRGKEKATPLEVVVDNSRGLFILHPNILVSGSRVRRIPFWLGASWCCSHCAACFRVLCTCSC